MPRRDGLKSLQIGQSAAKPRTRGRFNDYSERKYIASAWQWKWWAPFAPYSEGEDIVCTPTKAGGRVSAGREQRLVLPNTLDRNLKMSKTELENYAMLVMKLGINSDGEWEMDLNKAKEFYSNLADVLPEEVGAVLSPMAIDKIGFEKSNTRDTDTIAEAEQNLFTAAGVSTLLFNNDKASSNALLLSIKADQALTFGIVKSIETVINRFIHSYPYGKNFKVTFLDCSPWNRREMGDQYLKAAQYGFPTLSYFCASQGLSQAEMDGMDFLENEILELKKRFIPLRSSATTSSADLEADGEAGRPTKSDDELSDSGESSREHDDGDDSELG